VSRTFLVVDDDPDLRFLLDATLGRWGHRTLTATTFDEAHRFCLDERPDVLLLDVTMPEMDGPALLLHLREAGCAPEHVYLVSALEADELEDLARELGVGYLVKPFTLESLRRGIADVLDGPADGRAGTT
jgi:two-component system OmpR family response regulator